MRVVCCMLSVGCCSSFDVCDLLLCVVRLTVVFAVACCDGCCLWCVV